HMEHSRQDLRYFDPATNEKYIPYVVEPSLGVDRLTLAILCDAYDEEELPDGDIRTVLRFHPALAPVKIAVLPLSAKLKDDAYRLYEQILQHFPAEFDERQSIGRRYRRQDEIGTPYCVTFDFDSLEDNQVTVRERDSMEQVRLPISELIDWFGGKFDLP
ncbi:MAG TPA: glycine--tRNA ligase, partial [Clostridiaceae bacterium]|nr:glycine--tRNA ligase [Clostridiaceae bacterium]